MPSRAGLALLGVLTALAVLAPSAVARYRFAIAPSAAPARSTLELSFRAPWTDGYDCCGHYSYVMTITGPSEVCVHRAFPEAGYGPPDPTSVFGVLRRYGSLRLNGKRYAHRIRIESGDVVVLRFRAPRCAGPYRGVVEFDEEYLDAPYKLRPIGRFAINVTRRRVLAWTGVDTRLIAAAGATLLLGGIGLRRFAKLRS
jgi:hypothetical protein